MEKKFFKSKKQAAETRTTRTQTRKKAGNEKTEKNTAKQIEKKESLGYAANLRQTSLSESFSRGSLRMRLRPRNNVKDYKDSSNVSVILEKSISPQKRNSFVLLEKLDGKKNNNNKEPVYRGIKLTEKKNNTEDKDSVYDFQFDINDPKEKEKPSKTKRRKYTARKPAATKRKKKIPDKVSQENEPLVKKTEKKVHKDEKPEKKVQKDEKPEPIITEVKNGREKESEELAEPKEANISPENSSPIENGPEISPKVRICSIETLTGDRKVSFKPNPSTSSQSSAKFNPFRSTQSIFKTRSTTNVRDMMDHSLLNKSLSPIKNVVDNFDPASPWRPPLPNSFSSVKRIVQSTPQIKRNFARTTLGLRIEEGNENGENRGPKSPTVVNSGVQKAQNPLGAKIFNAENIQASNTKGNAQLSGIQETSPRLAMAKKPLGVSTSYGENKQNLGFGDRLYKSPKKNDKSTTSIGSPSLKKKSNALSSRGEGSREFTTQKKDSSLRENENTPPVEEARLLRQSNLNTFLNLDEMPESISINTSHGIFGDGDATPVINNRTNTQGRPGIDNCFGFDDECSSDLQESPVKLDRKRAIPQVKKSFDRLKRRDLNKEKPSVARISLGEIKNTLYPRREKKLDKIERIEERDEKKEAKEIAESKETKREKDLIKSKDILHPVVQFSDTFDILSESGQAEDNGESRGDDIPLFADLEPVHFTKPARWSYAKKRERKEYWSSEDDDDAEEMEDRRKPVLKKRKLVKLNKAEAKKIDEWVKSVNETFQEIDEFDLVVEKLP